MKILNDNENMLLKRKEFDIIYESEASPEIGKLSQEVSEFLKAPLENVVIKEAYGNFGSKSYAVKAFVYSDAKHRELIEPKPKPKKGAAGAVSEAKK